GDASALKALISAGADVNHRDHEGITALILAANRDDAEKARLLISAGARLNMAAADGTTALMAAAESNGRNVLSVLIDAKADPDRQHHLRGGSDARAAQQDSHQRDRRQQLPWPNHARQSGAIVRRAAR